jgi:hypothetical protein
VGRASDAEKLPEDWVLGFPSITNDLQGRTLNHAEYLASRADIRVDSTRNTAIRN